MTLASFVAAAALLPTLVLPAPAKPAAPATFRIDPTHSELTFQIRHLVSRVRGTFTSWGGTIVADPDNWSAGSVEVTIQTATITTNNERRDADLRSPNFFAADSFPTLTFKSSRVEASGTDVKVYGTLTMRGVSKPVVLAGHFLGMTTTAQGKRRIGFEAETTINRLDYGVVWNRAVEGGGTLLGDEVKIEVVVAGVEQ